MKAIFNSRIIESSDSLIKTDNRSFCYGDGLFETIVTGQGRINLIEKHLIRLKRGCEVMGIEFPDTLNAQTLNKMISDLKKENKIRGDVRSKLTIWRNSGGLYSPQQSDASFYLECKPSKAEMFGKAGEVDFSLDIHTHYSPISFAKTTSALTYVLAGIEKNNRALDDIILTDPYGNLSETHSSNLFWISNHQVYTPSLSTGCVEGIMRNALIEILKENGKTVKQVSSHFDVLYDAASVFSTNASGIRYFERIGKVSLKSPEKFLNEVLKQLQQP